MGYYPKKWKVMAPRDLERILRRLPKEIGRLLDVLIADFEKEGPFPKGWNIEHLSGGWRGYLKVRLKREYRVVYRYDAHVITIFIERVGHRKDVYER